MCYTRVHAYTGDVDDGVPPGDGHVGYVARARRRHDREVGAYVIFLYHIYICIQGTSVHRTRYMYIVRSTRYEYTSYSYLVHMYIVLCTSYPAPRSMIVQGTRYMYCGTYSIIT